MERSDDHLRGPGCAVVAVLRSWTVRIISYAIIAGTIACTSERDERSWIDSLGPTPPPPPAGCTTVRSSEAVHALLANPTVSAICLAPGRYRGPWVLTRKLALWGSAESIVAAPGGTIIDVRAPGATVLGMTLDGTGARFDKLDGAVRITADDVRVEGVTVVNAMFGIVVEEARRAAILRNRVHGSRAPATGLRGDTIRVWATHNSRIEDNVVTDGRDVVVWYSSDNSVVGNRIRGARYGIHFMYSHNNRVEKNQLTNGVVGIFVMYSRGVRLIGNLIANASGAAGMGIGLKDSGNIEVLNNQLIHNNLGLYIDSSPIQRTDTVIIRGNIVKFNDVGVVFHSSAHDLIAHANDFADNHVQVRVDGGGDAMKVEWRNNYFDDYEGYDLGGDGQGDVPYQQQSLSNELTSQHPELSLFRGTLAIGIVDAASHLDPLYQPKPILSDPTPRMNPLSSWELHGRGQP